MNDRTKANVRKEIQIVLGLLNHSLGHYEQTTHGSIGLLGPTIEAVADRLVKCYNDPTSTAFRLKPTKKGGLLARLSPYGAGVSPFTVGCTKEKHERIHCLHLRAS